MTRDVIAIGLYICVIVLTPFAARAEQAPPFPSAASLEKDVLQLGDKSEEVREIASDHILNSDPKLMPVIEAAAAKLPAGESAAKAMRVLLARLRPLAAARARTEEGREADYQWNRSTALNAYERFGNHDPKWDHLARKAIELYVSRRGDDKQAAYEALEHLTSGLNCNDPLIMYFDARLVERYAPAKVGPIFTTYLAACDLYFGGKYPAYRQCTAMVRGIEFVAKTNIEKVDAHAKALEQKWAGIALDLWPQAVAEPDLTPSSALDLALLVAAAQVRYGADRVEIIEKMLPPFEKAFPKSAIPLVFKGVGYTDFAWDARGFGYANTVTKENFQLFADRLQHAAAALEKAYEADPTSAQAATAMMRVELGQGRGREVMEKWFERAIAADPGHLHQYPGGRDAYDWKREYLMPRWHGSDELVLAFGHQCAATRNTYDHVTWGMVEAHEELVRYLPNKDTYWAKPSVWTDIAPVLLQFVNDNPLDNRARTNYARLAAQCGQWKLADEQFKQLGEHADVSLFGGQATFEKTRARVAEEAAKLR